MTMNRYGVVVPAGMDAKETYYYYKVKYIKEPRAKNQESRRRCLDS
jgi:hypothetical protein